MYIGDVNLKYGGAFFDMSTFKEGYVDCVQVVDLDSACGFSGAVMIQHLTILIKTGKDLEKALQCIGFDKLPRKNRKMIIVDACLAYGYFEPDYSWDRMSNYMEIVQCDSDGPKEFDRWTADYVAPEKFDLEKYVKEKHIRF